MDTWWGQIGEALRQDFFDVTGTAEAVRIVVRLVLAALFGGALGLQRAHAGKAAGIRTHMLVAIGAATFVLVPLQAGMRLEDLSRVMQGLITGIGFIAAGTIL